MSDLIERLMAGTGAGKEWMLLHIEAANRIAELETAQRWIPVDEQLPEMETPVLVVARGYKNRLFVTASMRVFVDEGWAWAQMALPYMPDLNDPSQYEFDDDFEYTHWMPMPQPPELGEV